MEKVYLHDSEIPGAGIGVFALKNIRPGELIEVCSVETFRYSEEFEISNELAAHSYTWGDLSMFAVAFGNGAFYNHSYEPNAVQEKRVEEKKIVFTAIREIPKDSEITINYNGKPDDRTPLGIQGIPDP